MNWNKVKYEIKQKGMECNGKDTWINGRKKKSETEILNQNGYWKNINTTIGIGVMSEGVSEKGR